MTVLPYPFTDWENELGRSISVGTLVYIGLHGPITAQHDEVRGLCWVSFSAAYPRTQ